MENKTYAEAYGILNGLTDFKIDFMSIDVVPTEDGSFTENRKVEHRVTLSLPLAKDLAQKLSACISDYEKKFGPILNLDEGRTILEKEFKNG